MILIRILVISIVTFLTVEAEAFQVDSLYSQEINISVDIDKTEVPLNETVSFKVVLSWAGTPDRYEIKEVLTPELSNFEITGSMSSSRSELKKGANFSIKEYVFMLKPVDIGMAYIDRMNIKYKLKGSDDESFLNTQRLSVTAISPVYPVDYSWIWKFGLGAVVVCFLGFFSIKYFRRKKEEKIRAANENIEVSFEDPALEEIRIITGQTSRAFKTRLDDTVAIFRNYLVSKFEIPEESRSDNAIKEIINTKEIGSDLCGKITSIFTQAEQIRFSGEEVTKSKFETITWSAQTCIEKLKNNNTIN